MLSVEDLSKNELKLLINFNKILVNDIKEEKLKDVIRSKISYYEEVLEKIL